MSKHTPGPWTAHEDGFIKADGKNIAEAFSDTAPFWGGVVDQHLPMQANARLIAAAPVMLEELAYASHALELASMEVPETSRERFGWHSKHLRRMIKLIEGDE